MVVGIDFRKFVCVAHVSGLPLVPSNSGGVDRRRMGFSMGRAQGQIGTPGALVGCWSKVARDLLE